MSTTLFSPKDSSTPNSLCCHCYEATLSFIVSPSRGLLGCQSLIVSRPKSQGEPYICAGLACDVKRYSPTVLLFVERQQLFSWNTDRTSTYLLSTNSISSSHRVIQTTSSRLNDGRTLAQFQPYTVFSESYCSSLPTHFRHTPHTTCPFPRDSALPDEDSSRQRALAQHDTFRVRRSHD